MAQDVTEQAYKICEMTGKSIDEIAYIFDLTIHQDSVIAPNRSKQSNVILELRRLEEKEAERLRVEKAEALRKERLSGFHWIKEYDNWVVAGDFTGKNIGDEITIMKSNGQKQERIIVRFTEQGNAYVK